jgi:hypothetical protein
MRACAFGRRFSAHFYAFPALIISLEVPRWGWQPTTNTRNFLQGGRSNSNNLKEVSTGLPYLNAEPLDVLVAEAGLSLGEFAEIAGVSELTLSKARHGRALKPTTLRKLALGLSRIKPLRALEGRDLIRATPHKKRKAANGADSVAAKEIGNAVRTPVEG